MALSTDLVVGAAPAEKAGPAAAVSETGVEFGIAVIGTIGAAAVVSVLLALLARLT